MIYPRNPLGISLKRWIIVWKPEKLSLRSWYQDEQALDIARSSEVGNRNKSKVPKNHPILNVIGTMDDSMVTRRQSRQNKIDFFCYTSQLEPKNVEEVLGDESWTTTP